MKNKSSLCNTRQFVDVLNTLRYVKMPLNTCAKYNLSPTQAVVYQTIKSYCKLKDKVFKGTALTLQVYCHISRRTVARTLSELVARGLIEQVDSCKNYPYYRYTKTPPVDTVQVKSKLQQQRINEIQETLRFIKMPLYLCCRYDLSPTQAMIYQIIKDSENFSEKVFTGSTLSLQVFCRVSRSTVVRTLQELCARGFIEKIETETNRPYYKFVGEDIKEFIKKKKRKKI